MGCTIPASLQGPGRVKVILRPAKPIQPFLRSFVSEETSLVFPIHRLPCSSSVICFRRDIQKSCPFAMMPGFVGADPPFFGSALSGGSSEQISIPSPAVSFFKSRYPVHRGSPLRRNALISSASNSPICAFTFSSIGTAAWALARFLSPAAHAFPAPVALPAWLVNGTRFCVVDGVRLCEPGRGEALAFARSAGDVWAGSCWRCCCCGGGVLRLWGRPSRQLGQKLKLAEGGW